MAELSIEALGISRDEIVERLVDRLAEQVLRLHIVADDLDGETPFDHPPHKASLMHVIEQRVVEKIDQAIDDIAARNVLPDVASYVETLCLQETNKWGEKIGKPVSFVEYLVKRAEAWITEQVDYQGKPKGTDSFSWRAHGTRISHMIHEHLDYQIRQAIQQALADLNKSVARGLHETVKLQLADVLNKLTVEVKSR